MPIINRTIEEHDDGLNKTYFLHGSLPLPKMLIDEIEGFIYVGFGWNGQGERMYYRKEYETPNN